jgi:hypothetical protein
MGSQKIGCLAPGIYHKKLLRLFCLHLLLSDIYLPCNYLINFKIKVALEAGVNSGTFRGFEARKSHAECR